MSTPDGSAPSSGRTHELGVAERLAEVICGLLVKNAPDEATARANVRDLIHGALVGGRAKAFDEAEKELLALRDEAEEDGDDALASVYEDAAELIRHVSKEAPRGS